MKALVTGATSGIGKKIAEKLSERGWKLILTGRNEEVLTEMKNRLGNTEIISADLSERKDVYRVYEFCKERDIDMLSKHTIRSGVYFMLLFTHNSVTSNYFTTATGYYKNAN